MNHNGFGANPVSLFRRRPGFCGLSAFYADLAGGGNPGLGPEGLAYPKFQDKRKNMKTVNFAAMLRDLYVTANDQLLIDTVFARQPAQDMLDRCLERNDIEVIGGYKSLLLSYLQKDHGELRFSEYAAPRLRGLIEFYRFANIKLLSHFSRIGKVVNRAGIPFVLLKGAAMKVLRPELPRPMNDVDILVSPERLGEVVAICESLGYHNAHTFAVHGVDMIDGEGRGVLDIHAGVFPYSSDKILCAGIFERAQTREAFGVRFLLPSKEDLLTILLVNMERNLREKSTLHSIYFSLLDCRFLLSCGDFDWSVVEDNLRTSGTLVHAGIGAGFMNTLVPGIIPDAGGRFPEFSARFYMEHIILPKRREDCRRILVVDLKRDPVFYGGMIIKTLILRKLYRFPPFLRWYLRRSVRVLARAR